MTTQAMHPMEGLIKAVEALYEDSEDRETAAFNDGLDQAIAAIRQYQARCEPVAVEERVTRDARHDCDAWLREASGCRSCTDWLDRQQDEIVTLTMRLHNARQALAHAEVAAENAAAAGSTVDAPC